MSRSPIVDVSLSDHESEDSYIMVSTNSNDSHEWDDVDEMRHDKDGDVDIEENEIQNEMQHENEKEHVHVENQVREEEQVMTEKPDIPSQQVDEWHQPHHLREEQQIQPISIDHTIDIAADTSDSDEDEDVEEQHTVADSICVCHIHYDDEEHSITSTPDMSERTLSIESSTLMPTPVVCDMEASLEPLVDEADTISTLPQPEHVIDAPDYPADLASSMLTDWEQKTHDSYDTPPDLYIDSYGFMHFARDPRYCVGDKECWEAKHIHEEPFVLERSSNVWSKGIHHDDTYETYDDDDDYPEYDTILQSKTRHKVNDVGIKKRVRGRKTGVTHAHLKLSQITPSTAKPTPITPTRTPSAPIPIRHPRSPSPSTSTSSPGFHKRRGPNFYDKLRGNRTRHAIAVTLQQQQQHYIDVEKHYQQQQSTSSSDDHCHGDGCNVSTCAHCRVVARRIKDQRLTRDRRYERDVQVEDSWD